MDSQKKLKKIMVDSISLFLHDLKKHEEITQILTIFSEARKNNPNAKIDFESYKNEILSGHLNMEPYDLIVKGLHHLDTNKKRDIIKGRIPAPSHMYFTGYRVNFDKDRIEISFSIPKYLYGTNVVQFLRNPTRTNKSFKGISSSFRENSIDAYDMLMQFIRIFFEETFIGRKVDYFDVEISRIDFCFNQYFRSKDDALYFLELAYRQVHKSYKKRFSESETMINPQKDQGLIVVSKTRYYKIYHKGTEFRKHDKKELIKKNDKSGIKRDQMKHFHEDEILQLEDSGPLWDVKTMEREADKILRHESRFWPANMSYFYKRYVYRKNDPEWKKAIERFNELQAKKARIERGSIERPFTRTEKAAMRSMKKKLDGRHRFFVRVDDEELLDGSGNGPARHFKKQHFSRELFNYLLIERFWKMVKSAQVKEMPKEETYLMALKEHNREIDRYKEELKMLCTDPVQLERDLKYQSSRRITETKLLKMLDYMERYESIDKALEKGRITKRTYYRWKKDLEILGIGTTVMRGFDIITDIDYFDYFSGILIEPDIYNAFFSNTKAKHRRDF